MTTSLYDASVGNYLQGLKGVSNFLAESQKFFVAQDIDPDDLTEHRIYPNMRPFRYQIVAAVHHSVNATIAMHSGQFSPPDDWRSHGYDELRKLVSNALERLSEYEVQEIDSLVGGEVVFTAGERLRVYSTEMFIFSFSLPQFYFHVTTAYAILRSVGVPIGKKEYMGPHRVKSG